MKSYQLIIFDWDGTIMDSEAHIVACMKSGIIDCGYKAPSDDEIKHIIGLGLDNAVMSLLPQLSFGEMKKVADAYRVHFFKSHHDRSQLFDGALNLIKTLKAQGFYLAVATGKSRRGLDLVLDQLDLQNMFDITRCADETASKPDPLMLTEILTDLDLDPSQALMIGDTSYDIEMAQAINMDTVAVTYGVHSKESLEKLKPDYIFNQITELGSLIKNE